MRTSPAHRGPPEIDVRDLVGRRFSRLAPLSPADLSPLDPLRDAPRRRHSVGVRLAREGEPAPTPHYIAAGWACRLRELEDGRRQILGLMIPGDAMGLCTRSRPLALTTVVSLTPLEVVDASGVADDLQDEARHPALADAVSLAAAQDEAFLLDHVVRLGRQTAYERTAHLFLELRWRLDVVGLTDGPGFALPLTQEVIADALGLSVVHVNRTLQQMRRDGLIDLKQGRLDLLDLEELHRVSEFKPPALTARTAPKAAE
jgi:CRP-like cAMP-binding protein